MKGLPGDIVNVRGGCEQSLLNVFHNLRLQLFVEKCGDGAIWIDGQQGWTDVCEYLFLIIASDQVSKDGLFGEVSHLAHIVIGLGLHLFATTSST